MTKYTGKNNTLSHPESGSSDSKTLIQHTKNVVENSKRISLNTEINSIEAVKISKDIAYLHDIGKTTQYFQEYIRDELSVSHKLKNHGFLGACITGEILAEKYNLYIGLVGFIAVRNHHGNLSKTLKKEIENFCSTNSATDAQLNILEKQLKNIKTYNYRVANTLIKKVDSHQNFKQTFQNLLEGSIMAKFNTVNTEKLYEDVLIVWSTLITSDKLDAAGISDQYFNLNRKFTLNKLNSHILKLQQKQDPSISTLNEKQSNLSQLNELREKARQTALSWAKNKPITETNTIYNLSLPTGFGKTFAGLSAGIKLANRKESNLIYTLPFTSIIDQVDEELKNVFDVQPDQNSYTIHHHMSDTKTKINEEHVTTKEELLLAKTWKSQVTLTTFVQLFESLTAPQNKQGIKLPALKDSVILLDEPQAISYDWWSIIPYLMKYLIERYNVTIISMTATQPTLFKTSKNINITEIIQNKTDYKKYLKQNPRVKYNIDNSVQNYLKHGEQANPLTYSNLSQKIYNSIQNQNNSVLSICNTIDSAQDLTKKLLKKTNVTCLNPKILKDQDITENTDIGLIHLTTRITSSHRKKLIKLINKRLEQNKRTIVISTQLIEAGVDLSFEKIYRDIAPLPSIVQAAGRCNRNNSEKIGTVTVVRLAPPSEAEHTPSSIVYNNGLKLLNATKNTLKPNKFTYRETQFSSLTQQFFNNINTKAGKEIYKKYLHDYRPDKLEKLSLINSHKNIKVYIVSKQKIQNLKKKLDKLNDDKIKEKIEYKFNSQNELNAVSISEPNEQNKPILINNTIKNEHTQTYLLNNQKQVYHRIYGLKLSKSSSNTQFIF